MNGSEAPVWDLTPIYPGFGSREYLSAKEELARLCAAYEAHVAASFGDFKAWLTASLDYMEKAGGLSETLGAYTYASYSVDTRDKTATAELNAIDELSLPLKRADVLFKNVLAANKDRALALCATAEFSRFAFFINDELFWQTKQMSPDLEDLAADLSRSGADAWSRLQETVSSNSSVAWDGDGDVVERKTVIQLRAMAFDKDRAVRQKAYKLELAAWKASEIPLAAALNGVKGATISLNKRRGWKDPLDRSVEQARITRATLDSLISAMEESLPTWRRYLKAKASYLGIPACSFYDIFAPVGSRSGEPAKTYTWDETREFIVDKFRVFSPEMGDFAADAFAKNWLDAKPREGKVGGAYCIGFPRARTSRIMCNFAGSFDSLTTVAHELGHAYHGHLLRDEPYVLTHYPMTLAETASIFAETIVFENAMEAAGANEKLGLIETNLQGGCQILVDILSRFYFERSVFERRQKGDLSPDELCALMLEAQEKTYGDGLNRSELHPYMWAVKGHYYSQGLSYYNFPYAFGQLFGLGLYATSRSQGPSFANAYRALLIDTGKASAVSVTKAAGFDIETPDFWRSGVSVFAKQIETFEGLVADNSGVAKDKGSTR